MSVYCLEKKKRKNNDSSMPVQVIKVSFCKQTGPHQRIGFERFNVYAQDKSDIFFFPLYVRQQQWFNNVNTQNN